MSERMARINRQLLVALAELVPTVRDPRLLQAELVVVQSVDTAPDLQRAKVFVSVAGSAGAKDQALRALRRASRFLRAELAHRLTLRRTPELQFLLDETQDKAARVDQILRELAGEGAMTEVSLDEMANALREADRLLVTTHPDPDADAIGSLLALSEGLRRLGKTVVAYNPDPVPSTLHFLDGSGAIVHDLEGEAAFSATVLVDCSDARMFPAGLPDRSWLGRVLVIDHHKTVGKVADLLYRDPTAAATGVMIHRVLGALGVPLDQQLAEAIYCALIADTGSFRYQNTTPAAMRTAAELLDHGVDPWRVASNLYESKPRRQLDLLVRALSTLQVSPDGLVAALTVTEEMLDETGCTTDMVDGFINYARSVEGVQVAVLFRPRADGVRVSLRSRGKLDVSQIAIAHGGGGHRNAAGFTAPGPAETLFAPLYAQVTELNQQAAG